MVGVPRIVAFSLAFCATVFSCPRAVHAGPPFAEETIESAIGRAQEQDRLVVVDFTAAWCGPCKRMDAESWPHDGVVTWIAANAIAIRIDVDEYPDVARRYSASKLPCIVAIRAGVEVDRVIGYRPPETLLAWLNDLLAGVSHAQEVLARATSLAHSSDVEARYELARDLADIGQGSLARREYTWVWHNTRGNLDQWFGVRHSFLICAMRQLAESSPDFMVDLHQWREQARRHVESDLGEDQIWWNEWEALALGTDRANDIPSWFIAERRRRRATSGSPVVFSAHVVASVFEILIDERRFREAAALYPDAVACADGILDPLDWASDPELDQIADPDRRRDVIKTLGEVRARRVADLVRALLSVRRDHEAERVAEMVLLNVDRPTTREALIKAAIDVKRRNFRPLRRWLKELDAGGVDTRHLRRQWRQGGRSL